MIDQWMEAISDLIVSIPYLAPFLALFAGVLTSVTPCSLSSVPLVIGYVGSGRTEPKHAFILSVIFAGGMAATYTLLGTVASLLGRMMGTSSDLWYIALGVLMVLMSLQIWEVCNFIPPLYLSGKMQRRGCLGAFLAGVLGGFFSSPCATPVLVVLLGFVARNGNIVWGIVLLLLYSAGHSVLVILAGTSISFVKKVSASEKYFVFSRILKYAMGGVVLMIGFYMFYLGF